MENKESIYQLLFENSGQGMVLRQGDKLVIVNQSFAEIVGYTIDELLTFSIDYATTHSYNELMQKALDEIGGLINSPIGFYHFVDEDQQSLSLQAGLPVPWKFFIKRRAKAGTFRLMKQVSGQIVFFNKNQSFTTSMRHCHIGKLCQKIMPKLFANWLYQRSEKAGLLPSLG